MMIARCGNPSGQKIDDEKKRDNQHGFTPFKRVIKSLVICSGV
jgi:hypothetical protein